MYCACVVSVVYVVHACIHLFVAYYVCAAMRAAYAYIRLRLYLFNVCARMYAHLHVCSCDLRDACVACMYGRICACMHVCMPVCSCLMHVCMHSCLRARVYACSCAHVHAMCACMLVCAHSWAHVMKALPAYVHPGMHFCMHAYNRGCVCVCVCACVCVCVCACGLGVCGALLVCMQCVHVFMHARIRVHVQWVVAWCACGTVNVTCACVPVCMCVHEWHASVGARTGCICVSMYVCMHICIVVCMRLCLHLVHVCMYASVGGMYLCYVMCAMRCVCMHACKQ